MTSKQAKEILALYRPDTADWEDSAFSKARQMARVDPELRRWFESHCASHRAMREKIENIPVPAGLMEQIISERQRRAPAESQVSTPTFPKYAYALVGAAMLIVLFVLVNGRFAIFRGHDESAFRSYRNRMVGTATRAYRMALTTNDLPAINAYLQRHHAPADYVLPKGLEKARAVGCAIVPCEGAPVAMICFNTGRPLRPGEVSDLWLFVADRAAVHNAPDSKIPALERTDGVATASWSEGGKSYLLAAPGEETFLRGYL